MNPDKSTPRFIPAKFEPTSEQKAIQTCTSKSVVAMASAGAAKSTTLALRIAELITRKYPAQSIIGLTFSQEAADVLKKYVREIGVPAVSARAVTVETFDAFASRILRERVDISPVPYLATFEAVAPKVRAAAAKMHERNQLRSVPRELWLPEHNDQIADALKTIRRLKGRLIAPEAPEGESLDSYAQMIGVPESILMLYRQLERDRTNSWNGCLWRTDFDATFDLACALRAAAIGLEAEPVNLPIYQAVIVDELQDMNPATACCLNGLRSNGKTYFTGAGDFDQIIHYWSGADISFIKNEFLPTILTPLDLTKTFRFGPSMAYAIASQKNKTVSSGRNAPASIRVMAYEHGKPESAATCVLEPIVNRVKAQKRLDTCAVILRSPHQSIHVENALLASGIGWRVQGFKSYFERPEVLMLRGVIAYALGDFKLIPDKRTRLDVLRALLFWQELGWSEERVSDLMSIAVNDDQTFMYFFKQTLLVAQTKEDRNNRLLSEEEVMGMVSERLEKLVALRREGRNSEADQIERKASEDRNTLDDSPARKQARDKLRRALDLVSSAPKEAFAHEVLERVVACLELQKVAKRLFIDPLTAEEVFKSIKGFVAAAAVRNTTLIEFANRLREDETRAENLRISKTVVLTTVEAAKGYEYDEVIIPYLETGEFPVKGRDLEEERNRFYVAITRMRDALTLITPSDPGRVCSFVTDMQIKKALRIESA